MLRRPAEESTDPRLSQRPRQALAGHAAHLADLLGFCVRAALLDEEQVGPDLDAQRLAHPLCVE